MSSRLRLGFTAGAATLFAAAPLATIFDYWTWLLQSAIVVALIVGAASLARYLRAPVWAQLVAMGGTLLISLTSMFPSGTELLAVLPSPGTFTYFGELLTDAPQDMRRYAVPVPDTNPLLFIGVLGVGAVAMVVDLLAVTLRRPALAGLPMLAIYSVPVAVHTDDVPALPFVIGAAGFLWLLAAENVDRVRRFGRRFTGDGRDIDTWEPSPLAAAGRRLAVLGLAVAVLLPLAVPGLSGDGLLSQYTGIGGEGNGRGGGTNPGQVNLFAALSGQLRQTETRPLVRVSTTEPNPFYLRFGVADEIRTDGFAVRSPNGRAVTRSLSDPRVTYPGVTYERYQANVEITSDFDMPLLPVYGEPVDVDGLDGSWLYDPALQVVFSTRSRAKGKKYSFDYVRARYTPQHLANAGQLPADHPMRQFTAVPPVPEVETLVAELTAGKNGDYERVRAIYDYFSRDNGFVYRLSTEGGTSSQDIVNFLDNKAGFCQQYAAAMAWLVRAAGVPARVAFGFTNGTRREGDVMILTNLNLHAWTEVYFDGVGWVPFDVTPAVPGSSHSPWAPDNNAPDPVTPTASTSAGAGANPTADPLDRDRLDEDVDAGLDGLGTPTTPGAPTWPWWTLTGLVVLLALLAIPAMRRTTLRRQRRARVPAGTTGPTVEPGTAPAAADTWRQRVHAHAAWDELIDTLTDFRIRTDPSETPRATANRLVVEEIATGAAADAVRLLGRAEERARYAPEPLAGDALTEALRTVRRTLSADADRLTRIRAALLPPSVLRRWRLGVGNAAGRVVAGVGRVRTGLLRWSPRRLLAGRTAR